MLPLGLPSQNASLPALFRAMSCLETSQKFSVESYLGGEYFTQTFKS